MVFNLLVNWQGFVELFTERAQLHLGGHIQANRVIRSASVFQGDLTVITRYLRWMAETNGLPSFFLLVAGFFYCLFRFPEKFCVVFIPIVSYYIFFLRIFEGFHLRYALPVFLLLTWYAGKFASDFIDAKNIPKAFPITIIGLILTHSLVYGFSVNIMLARDPRYTAEEWMERNIPAEAVILAVHPDYSLPRFPRGRDVRYQTLWHGRGDRRQANSIDFNPDYIVVSMDLPVRLKRQAEIEAFFKEQGYQEMASFKSETPFWGAEIQDLFAINQRIVIFRRS